LLLFHDPAHHNPPEVASLMKVFLSHSTRDKDFVEKLAAAMTASGFEPWRCEVDIDKGANFIAAISKGLKQADLTLLVWSPDAANSPWTEEEWTVALKQQVEQSRIRFGIIMLREHPLPPLLDTKNYIDARVSHDAGIRDALEWLERRRKAQRFSGLKAPIYLPDYRPQDFVGRSTYLERLRNALTWEPGVFLLHGEPGTGKSMLALKFAWEVQKDFDAVIFQTCGQRPLDAITTELADRLPIDVKTRPPEEQRAAAKAWLRERQSLLVLDDVWSAEMRQLEPGPNCSVLYTSRLKSLPGLSSELREQVESFTEPEAEALFHAYLDKDFGDAEIARNREALLSFARRVEMLPIAVAVGASLLREKSASALGRAVLKLRLDNLTDGSKDVNALFGTAIESQPEREKKLLAACAVCVQEGFWLPLAAEIAELSEDDTEDAADRLVHSSLLRVVDRERRRFNLHALLREQVRTWQGDGLSKLQERHAAALERIFQAWEAAQDQEARWQDCRECLEEIIPAASFLSQLGQSERDWRLGLRGYSLADRIGEPDAALRIMQHAESSRAGRDDRESKLNRSASYGNQALILQAWGRLEEALELSKKAEAVFRELGDKDGLQTCYGNQGLILYAWGRLEEALALHRKKEAICLEMGDKDSLQRSYGNQALILYAWGRLEEAMELLRKQEDICLELVNKDSLQRSYANQAVILQMWGRLEEALALHRQQEAIALELGNKDQLQLSYGNQATILYMCGRLEEALALYKQQEAICLELGNKDGLQISYGNQALILQAWGRLEEALALHKKEEAICLELGNKDGLSRSYGNQALILRRWGRLEEALDLHKKEEAICLEMSNQSGLGYCYWNWGLLARAQGDRKAEKEKLEQALAIFTELKDATRTRRRAGGVGQAR
jgi:tetratricopeptide (TPR) repeat protein